MSTCAFLTERSMVVCTSLLRPCGTPWVVEAPRFCALDSSWLMSARKRGTFTPDVMWNVSVPPTSALPTLRAFVSQLDGSTPSALKDDPELLPLDCVWDFS